ncbi:MAG: hypothetical protein ABI882_15330, partial [Acidobacteriota bacterium]
FTRINLVRRAANGNLAGASCRKQGFFTAYGRQAEGAVILPLVGDLYLGDTVSPPAASQA